jgi:hypothetical protein
MVRVYPAVCAPKAGNLASFIFAVRLDIGHGIMKNATTANAKSCKKIV